MSLIYGKSIRTLIPAFDMKHNFEDYMGHLSWGFAKFGSSRGEEMMR